MRFRASVVFARVCGAAGLGVFLGAGAAGLVSVITGSVFAHDPAWLTGVPVLAVLGAVAGLVIAWITRRWFAPHVPYRRWLFTAAGMLVLPLATAVSATTPVVAFPIIAAAVVLTVSLWVRGFRRETAQARAMTYGYGRPAADR